MEILMAHAVRFYETGGPEVLRYEQVDVGEPGPGQVRIRHAAVGLNFADTYFRLGYYPVPVPNGMGVEASGVIEAVGGGVNGFVVGDRVTYTGSPLGAYSTERVMPAGSLFKLPDGISCETAAASTMRGLSAAYWLLKTNPWMKAGDTILLHAAAGGVGRCSGPSCSGYASLAPSRPRKRPSWPAPMAVTRSSITAARTCRRGSGS
jgi:NADPH2:quinone reductase